MTAVFGAPEWRASSGRKVELHEDGTVTFEGVHGYLNPGAAMDAEELFQAKRDADLGRWRWPENPDWIVYLVSADNALALNEKTGEADTWSHKQANRARGDDATADAALAYFEANPERKLPTEPGTVLQGTGPNRSILHRSYAVNGHAAERPWVALGGAEYDDEGAWRFFHGGQFVVLVRPGDAS